MSKNNPEVIELLRDYLNNKEEIYAEHLEEERIIYDRHLEEKNRIYEKAIREEKGITPAEVIWKQEELKDLKWTIRWQVLKKSPYKRWLLREIYEHKINYPGRIISEFKTGHSKEDINTVLDELVEEDILAQDENGLYYLSEHGFDELFD